MLLKSLIIKVILWPASHLYPLNLRMIKSDKDILVFDLKIEDFEQNFAEFCSVKAKNRIQEN